MQSLVGWLGWEMNGRSAQLYGTRRLQQALEKGSPHGYTTATSAKPTTVRDHLLVLGRTHVSIGETNADVLYVNRREEARGKSLLTFAIGMPI